MENYHELIEGKVYIGGENTTMHAATMLRAVNDEEKHQIELLYSRGDYEQPMHPSGKRFLLSPESLTFNFVLNFHRTAEPDCL
ncbi:hypothetical protein AMQ84_05390 [Paenibacillus riograndensis]|uniref:Uncharacterized protein n=1 Tax=Paenibacillus riograndensis TaxID=483937 RepID=A0A132U8B0_9BACL|nr:hypothetical protein AMQ84_05390 [Paenibacillus riograndensis]